MKTKQDIIAKFLGRIMVALGAIVFIIAFSASCTLSYAKKVNLDKHPIYAQIINNRSSINKAYAMKLSNIIYKKSKQYNIDSRIFTAMLAQESMYKLTSKNCTTGYKTYPDKTIYKIVKVCSDFGLSQIHYRTAEKYKFDVARLTTDLEYSVDAGMQVLSYFKKRYKKKEPDTYWSYYNTSTPSKRKIYEELVMKYY